MWWLLTVALTIPAMGDGPGVRGPYDRETCHRMARAVNDGASLEANGRNGLTTCLTAAQLEVWRARMVSPSTRNRG